MLTGPVVGGLGLGPSAGRVGAGDEMGEQQALGASLARQRTGLGRREVRTVAARSGGERRLAERQVEPAPPKRRRTTSRCPVSAEYTSDAAVVLDPHGQRLDRVVGAGEARSRGRRPWSASPSATTSQAKVGAAPWVMPSISGRARRSVVITRMPSTLEPVLEGVAHHRQLEPVVGVLVGHDDRVEVDEVDVLLQRGEGARAGVEPDARGAGPATR